VLKLDPVCAYPSIKFLGPFIPQRRRKAAGLLLNRLASPNWYPIIGSSVAAKALPV
jgi:hypothetical protein